MRGAAAVPQPVGAFSAPETCLGLLHLCRGNAGASVGGHGCTGALLWLLSAQGIWGCSGAPVSASALGVGGLWVEVAGLGLELGLQVPGSAGQGLDGCMRLGALAGDSAMHCPQGPVDPTSALAPLVLCTTTENRIIPGFVLW